jgi:hypothetical protein
MTRPARTCLTSLGPLLWKAAGRGITVCNCHWTEAFLSKNRR